MVDSALYTGSNAAGQSLRGLAIISNNLANINTTGFRADYKVMTSEYDPANPKKLIAVTDQTYVDPKQGPVNFTGRELDVAINGPGYLAVQNQQGNEAYTRNGALTITPEGFLVNGKGDLVLGTNGIISVPPAASVTVDKNGIVYARLKGDAKNTISEIGRLKTVEIPDKMLTKGTDGLFYPAPGGSATVSQNVLLVPESLEGSNVDPVRSLVELIDNSRQFDLLTKFMSTVDNNAETANQLLNSNA